MSRDVGLAPVLIRDAHAEASRNPSVSAQSFSN